MKFASISILLSCLLTATFSNWLVILSFRANQSYIARTLCINRNNPQMHCNGKCYLCKQLNQNQKQDASGGISVKDRSDMQLFCNATAALQPFFPTTVPSYPVQADGLRDLLLISGCFHPPQA